MYNQYPGYIVSYRQGTYCHFFVTLVGRTKKSPWEGTWKIGVWGHGETLEAAEDILTKTKSQSHLPTNLEDIEKIGWVYLTKEYMAKLWLAKDLLGLW